MARLTPDRLLTLYETVPFARRWAELGLSDADLAALQWQIMTDPDAGAVVKGASGVRKVRFAPPGRGKSGAFRVYYAHLPRYGAAALVVAFAKNKADDLPKSAVPHLVAAVSRLAAELEARKDRR